MKKHILPLLAVLCLCTAPCAAQIPNASFETWSDHGGFDEPNGWVSFNDITFFTGGVLCCEQQMPGAVGSSCAKITTRNIPQAGGTVPGTMYTSTDPTGIEGFPWNQHSAALNFQWKYAVQPNDQAVVTVTMSRWNTSTQQRDEIGYGVALASGTLGTWQAASAPITYTSELLPDTANIYVLSSAAQASDGSTISVDALSFGAATGIVQQEAPPALALYPSPATDHVTITSAGPIANVRVLDLAGRQVLYVGINEVQASLDVTALPSATYVALIRFTDGHVATRSFSKR